MARKDKRATVHWGEIRSYAERFEEYAIIKAVDLAGTMDDQQALEPTSEPGPWTQHAGGRRFGPLEVGMPLATEWHVEALAAAGPGLRVVAQRSADERVTFDVGAPHSEGSDGPFEADPLRLTYRSTPVDFQALEPAGKALRDLLLTALGEGEEQWDTWLGELDARHGPGRARTLPDAEIIDIRPDGKVYLRITDSCQERCKFCFFFDTDEVDNLVRNHDLDRVVRSLDPAGISQVILTGGEPTLHPRLPDYVRALYESGFRQIIIQTNGIGLAREGVLERLLPYRDRLGLGFSLHAATAETNDAVTMASQGFFPDKLVAIRRALALGFGAKITLVLNRHNLGELVEFIELCDDLRGDGTMFLQFSLPSFRGRMNLFPETYPRLSELAVALPPALARARELDLRVAMCHICQIPPCILPNDLQHLESLWFCDVPGMWSAHDRAYAPQCEGCAMRPWCSGLWDGYAEHFGTDELVPFTEVEMDDPEAAPGAMARGERA